MVMYNFYPYCRFEYMLYLCSPSVNSVNNVNNVNSLSSRLGLMS